MRGYIYKILVLIPVLLILNSFIIIQDSKAQWVSCSEITGMGTYSIDTIGQNIYCGTYQGGVFLSSNNGLNWVNICNGQLPPYVFSITHNNNYLFAYVSQNGIYRTSNNGANWTRINTTLFTPVKGLIANNNYLFSSGVEGIYLSSNNGDNWVKTPDTLFYYSAPSVYAFAGQNLLAGTGYNMYITSNNGQNWSKILNNGVWAISVQGTKIYTNPLHVGVVVSTNYGNTWSQIASYSSAVGAFENYIFIAGKYDSISMNNFFMSSNNGINWINMSTGLSPNNGGQINIIFTFKNFVFLAMANANLYQYNTLWRRSLSEIITGIQNISTEIPSSFSLSQNYPNPFNPTTTIRFDIPAYSVGQTFLSVYDILGREVATLVNEQLAPGTYSVDWNASAFPSGIYFYRLTTEGFSETKKMLMIK